MSDGASDSLDASPSDAEALADAATAKDAAADANAPPETCDEACLFDLCAGAACAVTKVATASGARVTWQSPRAICTGRPQTPFARAPPVRALPAAPWWPPRCAARPLLRSSGSRVAGVDYLFTTDNQYTQGLYRLEYDGAPLQSWGSADGNAAPLAMFGAVVVWGDQSSTYRASTGTAGTTTVMNVGPARVYTGALGPARRSVAVDANYVFSASNSDVFKCPIGDTCLTAPATAASSALPNVWR